jgi:hypothetical protein
MRWWRAARRRTEITLSQIGWLVLALVVIAVVFV